MHTTISKMEQVQSFSSEGVVQVFFEEIERSFLTITHKKSRVDKRSLMLWGTIQSDWWNLPIRPTKS